MWYSGVTPAPRSKPYLGSPRASNRRAIGTSSAVTTRAREAPRCGASHVGARRRTEFGRTPADPGDDPVRPLRPAGPQILSNLGQRHKPQPLCLVVLNMGHGSAGFIVNA